MVLVDGKIDVAEKSDSSEPAEEVNGVEKPGDVINVTIDGNERIVTFSEDSDENIIMLIETDDPNVEPVNLPADFVMSVRNALQTINPNWGIVNNFEQWSNFFFENGSDLDSDVYDLLEAMYSALTDMSYCI